MLDGVRWSRRRVKVEEVMVRVRERRYERWIIKGMVNGGGT